jgi:hypothetical protein
MITKWNHRYNLEELLKETNKYQNKRYIVKNKQEILKIIQDL